MTRRLDVAEVHSYSDGLAWTRVIITDTAGNEVDLTQFKVAEVERKIVAGEMPTVTVTFFARLVEHEAEGEAA